VRYRWAVLASGTAAQASFSAITIGLAVLAPVLREELDLSLGEIGLLLSATWVGAFATLLPWGIAADRFGERTVLALGLSGSALCLVGAAFAVSFASLYVLLVLAGASGASVNSASGRAVMRWFDAHERGLALGVRQTAIPLGGLVAALAVPRLAAAGGSEAALLFLAAFCAAGALAGALVLRAREPGWMIETTSVEQTLRDGRLWRLSLASGLYVYAQVAVIGFGVLFLHDEHGVSNGEAALVIAAAQVLAAALRIGAGRWSDLLGSRVRPLRRLGLAVVGTLLSVSVLAGGPVWLLLPLLAVSGGLSMAWNGLAFTAAAEIAGLRRSGAAIGFQLAALFPLAGWWGLRPLDAH
jgi:sugar phosphate permease